MPDPTDQSQAGEPALVARLVAEFRRRYDATPRVFFAPGRANLLGAHLDYNGGEVLPVALARGTWVAVASRPGREARFASLDLPGEVEVELADLPGPEALGWSAYPIGVWVELGDRVPGGFDFLASGNLPRGGGLSSSASISVATALALSRLHDLGLGDEDLARTAWAAETGFVGVQCGIMDQYAAAMSRAGQAFLLDCLTREIDYVPLDETLELLVLDTRKPRKLVSSAFNQRVEECRAAYAVLQRRDPDLPCLARAGRAAVDAARADMGETVWRRARHIVDESERMRQARAALAVRDHAALGRLVREAHESCRGFFEVSCDELDFLVDGVCAVPGVHGARLTGAGFGGCVVALGERGAVGEPEAEALLAAYRARFGWDAALLRLDLGGELHEVAVAGD